MPETPKAYLIAGLSGRSLAAAAHRAGHRARVVDLYNDADLRDLAEDSLQAKADSGGGFNRISLIEAADRLASPDAPGECLLVYGAGFEDRPDLLERLARGRRLCGNRPEAVARIKDPDHFFPLLGRLDIPHPEVRLAAPGDPGDWLVKRVGGAGGVHIYPSRNNQPPGGPVYFQRRVAGRSISAFFLADGRHAHVLGFSEQWCSPPHVLPGRPYRFGGAVAPIPVDPGLEDGLTRAADALAGAYGLVGLNSLDVIVPRERRASPAFYVIEVNPRPGATLDLFDRRPGHALFDLHVKAGGGEPPPGTQAWLPDDRAFACAIFYTGTSITTPAAFAWPGWTADRPNPGTFIAAGGPVCTVFAEGKNPSRAHERVIERSGTLRRSLSRSKGASSI